MEKEIKDWKVVVIADGAKTVDLGEKPDWKALGKVVGGFIERVTLAKLGKGIVKGGKLTMVVDEEGKIKKDMILNPVASAIFYAEWGWVDAIAGKAVLLKETPAGNFKALTPEEALKVVLRVAGFLPMAHAAAQKWAMKGIPHFCVG